MHYEATRSFYVVVFGMAVEWEPDQDNVYLTSGSDNLAIHRCQAQADARQTVDHIGFIVAQPAEVDAWHEYLLAHDVVVVAEPRTHRDGARSLYCRDPAGLQVQVIYHPPLSDSKTD